MRNYEFRYENLLNGRRGRLCVVAKSPSAALRKALREALPERVKLVHLEGDVATFCGSAECQGPDYFGGARLEIVSGCSTVVGSRVGDKNMVPRKKQTLRMNRR